VDKRLQVRLLGVPEASLDGQRVAELKLRKTQRLLYLLAAQWPIAALDSDWAALERLPEVAASTAMGKSLFELRHLENNLLRQRHSDGYRDDGSANPNRRAGAIRFCDGVEHSEHPPAVAHCDRRLAPFLNVAGTPAALILTSSNSQAAITWVRSRLQCLGGVLSHRFELDRERL
jgi:hypothetical protein